MSLDCSQKKDDNVRYKMKNIINQRIKKIYKVLQSYKLHMQLVILLSFHFPAFMPVEALRDGIQCLTMCILYATYS